MNVVTGRRPPQTPVPPALGITVVVATYRRLPRLAKCLDGIRSQTLSAEEVLVVTHADPDSDRFVGELARDWAALRLVKAEDPGSVAAYNAGLRNATSHLVAYIDDDAAPASDWLERIVMTFAQDERIAAVGGRDVIFADGRPQAFRRRRHPHQVGVIHRSGRMKANHHLGSGPPRDVDVLKGVNMSFRRSEVRQYGFDSRLRGPGAVVHAELSICLPLRKQGLRVVYDPAIVVFHHPAPRPAGDHREAFNAESAFNAAHNAGLEILEYLPPGQRQVFILGSALIGNSESPGLAVLIRDWTRGRPAPFARFVAAQRGRLEARRTSGLPRVTLAVADGPAQATEAEHGLYQKVQ